MPPLGPNGPPTDPERVVDYARIQAAAHNRPEIVEFLLTKSPDLEFRKPFFDANARSVARYFGNDAILALLDAAAFLSPACIPTRRRPYPVDLPLLPRRRFERG
jgi:hypothetical protein